MPYARDEVVTLGAVVVVLRPLFEAFSVADVSAGLGKEGRFGASRV